MNIEESIQQIKTLIEAWQLDEADLNQTDINAMQVLLKENKELKKQLDEYKKQLKPNYYVKGLEGTLKEYQQEMNKVAIQQKEFIKYLEDEIKELQEIKETELDYDILKDVIPELLFCKDVLQKYKSIIGD